MGKTKIKSFWASCKGIITKKNNSYGDAMWGLFSGLYWGILRIQSDFPIVEVRSQVFLKKCLPSQNQTDKFFFVDCHSKALGNN
jgi:hypothetical protein